jgi:hypothetical protein
MVISLIDCATLPIMKRRHAICIAAALALVMLMIRPAAAGVVVFDAVAVAGRPVFIKVLTKGRLFPDPGRRVRITVGSDPPRTILTGGDGRGYFKYTPATPGRMVLDADADGEVATGALLVVSPVQPVVVVEIDGGLRADRFPGEARKESQRVLRDLAGRYPLAYLYDGWGGAEAAGHWLEQHGYPQGILLAGDNGATVVDLARRQVPVAAVIASADTADSATGHGLRAVSFEKSKKAARAGGWSDIPAIISAHPETASFGPGRRTRAFSILEIAPLFLRLRTCSGLPPSPRARLWRTGAQNQNLPFLDRH